MKKKLITMLISVIITGFGFKVCAQKPVKYITLTKAELIQLGFVINDEGIFFKSVVPKDIKDRKDHIAGFFNDKKIYGTTYEDYAGGFKPDTLSTDTLISKGYERIKPLKVDYHIMVVADMKGHRYFDFYKKDVKVVPVLLNQSSYKLDDKKDLIIYFNYTDELAGRLPGKDVKSYVTTLSIEK